MGCYPALLRMQWMNVFKHFPILENSSRKLLGQSRRLLQQTSCSYFDHNNRHSRRLNMVAPLLQLPKDRRDLCFLSGNRSSSVAKFCLEHFHTASGKQTFVNRRNYCNAKANEPAKEDTSSILETWFYEVSPYGSIEVNMPFETVIKPLNPQNYPDMNKCIIELCFHPGSSSDKIPDAHQLSLISDMYKLDVDFDKDKAHMNVSCDPIKGFSLPVCCYLHVPLKADLNIVMKGEKGVSVESMESNNIMIETSMGNVNLRKLKCGSVSAVTQSGDIVSKSTLLGNVNLHCGGTGMISADKLQGSSMTCSTEMGAMHVKSLYTQGATFKTVVGDISLGQCHGQLCVAGDKSNLVIESLEGDLDAGIHQGSIKVLLSRHNKVDIDLNSGNIDLNFLEGTRTDLTLSCPSVTVADNLSVQFDDNDTPHYKEGHIGEKGGAKLNARTLSGTIHLSMLDWIESTKLAFLKTGFEQ